VRKLEVSAAGARLQLSDDDSVHLRGMRQQIRSGEGGSEPAAESSGSSIYCKRGTARARPVVSVGADSGKDPSAPDTLPSSRAVRLGLVAVTLRIEDFRGGPNPRSTDEGRLGILQGTGHKPVFLSVLGRVVPPQPLHRDDNQGQRDGEPA
jgi:hypothetical protein